MAAAARRLVESLRTTPKMARLPRRLPKAETAKTAAGPPSPIRIPAPSGPISDPELSPMPETTLAAVRSSGEATTSGMSAAWTGRDVETSVAATVARA